MQIGKYLQNYQPVIYQTFVNSLKNKTLSHAYLLVGNPGTPLFDTAKYLAKSIICDDPSPLACDNCITCLRYESDNYPDAIFLDGSLGTIKKEDVLNIESRFDKTALDKKGVMIYVINLVENMTIDAVNSMLKFLEEPGAEIYAFLTTNNENNVLPTIISRCQTLYLKSRNRQDVIDEALDLNVKSDDAELLSYFYNDGEKIFELLNNDTEEKEDYLLAKELLFNLLSAYVKEGKEEAIYFTEKELVTAIKDKVSMRYFIDMLTQVFEDLVNLSSNREIILKSYATILNDLLNKLPHINETLVELLKERNLVNVNVNIALQLDHLINYITKETL